MGELSGKVAIVTGAGRGIGREEALALAREGAAVVVNDLGVGFQSTETSDTPAEEVARLIRENGGRAIADTTDISDWDAVGRLVERTVKEFGDLDIIVNNAALFRFGNIDQISKDDWEHLVAVNLNGPGALTHWAAKHWRAKGPAAGRRIVNLSSGVGLWPIAGSPMYAAVKAGIAAFTISCAQELADLGVRANAIAPAARTRCSEFVVGAENVAEVKDAFDFWSPKHPAELVTFLALPSCPFTGQVIGIIGDYMQLLNGWSVDKAFSNNGKDWTLDDFKSAFATVPVQRESTAQSVPDVAKHLTPPDATLEQLAAVENG